MVNSVGNIRSENNLSDVASAVTALSNLGGLGIGGNSSATTTLATGGTTGRTLAAWLGDVVNAVGQGCDNTGGTVTTTLLAAAATVAVSAGKPLYLPAGVYSIDNWTIPSGVQIIGAGIGLTILRRAAAATGNSAIKCTSGHGLWMQNLTVDGNLVNTTTAANNITLTSCYDYHFLNVEMINAKAVSGFGNGFESISAQDVAQGTFSEVSHCRAANNGASGISFFTLGGNVSVCDNRVTNNGGSGIVITQNAFPPVAQQFTNIEINRNWVFSNNGTGITCIGFFVPGASASVPIYGIGFEATWNIIISENWVQQNTAYGIAAQVSGGLIAHNRVYLNGGTGSFLAGILAGAEYSTFCHNYSDSNEFYGMDAGGAYYCNIHHNHCWNNGVNSTSNAGNGINISGGRFCDVDDNDCGLNGGSAGGQQISCARYEGANALASFPWDAEHVRIRRNKLTCASSVQNAIVVKQDPLYISVNENTSTGNDTDTCYILESTILDVNDNVNDASFAGWNVSVSSNVLKFPDHVDSVIINGSASSFLNTVQPRFVYTYINAVYAVKLTNRGTGYSSSVSVVGTGGGGTGFAATALLSPDPAAAGILPTTYIIANVRVDTPGTGYTSAPAITFVDAGGTGSGALATAFIAPWPTVTGRELTVLLATTMTFGQAGKLNMAQSTNYNAAVGDVLKLTGISQLWKEDTRYLLTAPVRVITASGAATITNTDSPVIIMNQTTPAAVVVNLPATPVNNKPITVKDGGGVSAVNPITLTPNAGTIDGASTYVIATNYESITIVYNGTQWNVI